jgi:hypothetical protein
MLVLAARAAQEEEVRRVRRGNRVRYRTGRQRFALDTPSAGRAG